MRRERHLLKHKGKLHSFLRHALHIQETVELKIQLPLAFVLSFLAASKPETKQQTNLSVIYSTFWSNLIKSYTLTCL